MQVMKWTAQPLEPSETIWLNLTKNKPSTALLLARGTEVSSPTQVQDLLAAQQRSKDGVIKFSPSSFSKFVTGKQRPFALFMFLTARHLMDNANMQLGPMREDFGYVAKHLKERIAKGDFENPSTLFFAEAEFRESQEVNCLLPLPPSPPRPPYQYFTPVVLPHFMHIMRTGEGGKVPQRKSPEMVTCQST